MLTDELIPLCQRKKLGTGKRRIGLLGISMGGYGALLLAEKHPHLLGAAAAISPAIWTSYAQAKAANPGAYATAADFAADDAVTHASALKSVPVRIASGYGDPFYPGVRTLVSVLPANPGGSPPELHFGNGCHTGPFFTAQEPPSLAFLARHLANAGPRDRRGPRPRQEGREDHSWSARCPRSRHRPDRRGTGRCPALMTSAARTPLAVSRTTGLHSYRCVPPGPRQRPRMRARKPEAPLMRRRRVVTAACERPATAPATACLLSGARRQRASRACRVRRRGDKERGNERREARDRRRRARPRASPAARTAERHDVFDYLATTPRLCKAGCATWPRIGSESVPGKPSCSVLRVRPESAAAVRAHGVSRRRLPGPRPSPRPRTPAPPPPRPVRRAGLPRPPRPAPARRRRAACGRCSG